MLHALAERLVDQAREVGGDLLAGIERGGGGVAEQVVGDFQRGEGVVGPRGDEAIAVGVGEERCVVAGVVDDGHGAHVVGPK